MVFNSDNASLDIVTFANKLVKSTNTSFPIAEKVLYANEGERIIWSWIHEAYGGWGFDDKNYTDFPEATTTLTSGIQDYTIPVDASFVRGVSVKNTSGVWTKLEPVTLEQILAMDTDANFFTTNSNPRFYRMLATSIKLYPTSNYTQSASLRLSYTRDISGFAATDTTKTPGFDTAHHEAVPTYIALQYARINQLPIKNDLELQWQRYEKRIKSDYSRRFNELYPARFTVRDAVRENQ